MSAQPRVVRFVVVDELSDQSEPAVVTVNFQSIDNPPVLDLNGPQQPGRDISVTYVEESDPIMVSFCLVLTLSRIVSAGHELLCLSNAHLFFFSACVSSCYSS